MSPCLDPCVAAVLPQLSLKEWAELLYHAAEFLHGLDRDASCYAHRASACITQRLAERRQLGSDPSPRVC